MAAHGNNCIHGAGASAPEGGGDIKKNVERFMVKVYGKWKDSDF